MIEHPAYEYSHRIASHTHGETIMIPTRRERRAQIRAITVLGGCCTLAVGGLGLPLGAGPAEAAPAFLSQELSYHAQTDTAEIGEGCSWSTVESRVPDPISLAENSTLTTSVSSSHLGTAKADPDDRLSVSSQLASTVTTVTSGGVPRSIRVDFRGSTRTTATKTASAGCRATPSADLDLSYDFVTTMPLWATLSYSKLGASYTDVYINETDGPRYDDLYGWSDHSSGNSTILLPAGRYGGYLQVTATNPMTSRTESTASRGTVAISFAVVGSASTAPAGQAQRYAALGQARNCSIHALPVRLTSSRARAEKMARVSFAVNGTTIATLRGRQIARAREIRLPLADTAAATVTTTVKLKDTRRHGKLRVGKTLTARASYRPCA